jgi:hypothetical protein
MFKYDKRNEGKAGLYSSTHIFGRDSCDSKSPYNRWLSSLVLLPWKLFLLILGLKILRNKK